MTTTIQISDTTKQLLETFKTEKKTYDDIIRELAHKKLKIPKSGFGMTPGLSWNKEEDRLDLDDR
jgi:predicted CopG family antitoxin